MKLKMMKLGVNKNIINWYKKKMLKINVKWFIWKYFYILKKIQSAKIKASKTSLGRWDLE